MQRVRITIQHNPDNPTEDLRRAAQVRRDLWAHSAVEIDPDSPKHQTHRDGEQNAYFEFVTDRGCEVERVLRDFGHREVVRLEVVQEGSGTECVNCGNISPEPVTVCPHCGFRDIDPCPYCRQEIARLAYISVGGDVFKCPACHHRVRFQFNDPLVAANGRYNQPLVRVNPTEAPVGHGV